MLILAVIGVILIQNPDAPLPWKEPPLPSTDTAIPPTVSITETLMPTSTGTRRPSHTPVKQTETPNPENTVAATLTRTAAQTNPPPSASVTLRPTRTATITQTPTKLSPTNTNALLPPIAPGTSEPTSTAAPSATLSPTPLESPLLVTGRVVDQNVPIANVTVILEGPSVMTAVTNENGAYAFLVDWNDVDFSVVFSYEANPQVGSPKDYLAWAWIESRLQNDIEVPDLEISAMPEGIYFQQLSPVEGSTYSAYQISDDAPLRFEWTAYPQVDQYWIDLGREDEETPAWYSPVVTEYSVDFDGILKNGAQISEGTYWWAVGAIRTETGFRFLVYTQDSTLYITP